MCSGNPLLYLDDLLGRLSRKRQTTILLLDEVQELSRHPDNAPLVSTLRPSLDKRSDRLKVVFTGSSREGLTPMFNSRQAPFFHFATPVDLPPFDELFADHLLKVFRKTANRTLDQKIGGSFPCRVEIDFVLMPANRLKLGYPVPVLGNSGSRLGVSVADNESLLIDWAC